MKYDLSVIIPTYNNFDTLDRCIKSILSNNINIEIIVVDDGSVDDISYVLAKYDCIKYIKNKCNKGVSYSRNVGLKNISADYFTFVDADDYLESGAYDYLIGKCHEFDLDLCGFNYYKVSKKKKLSRYFYNEFLLDANKLMDMVLLDELSFVIWDKIYKYEIFKDLRFNESLMINEDYDYTIRGLQLCNKALFLNKYFYNYCVNISSLSHNYLCSQVEANNYYLKLDKTKLINNKNFIYFDCYQNVKLLHLFLQCNDRNNRYVFLTKYVDNSKLRKLLKFKINLRVRFEIYLYLFSVKIYLLFFDLYRGIFHEV